MLRTNYHTHTSRCGHAKKCADEVYVENALASGLTTLGFSDHTPWPYESGYIDEGIRMKAEELDDYIASIRALKKKYAPRSGGEAPCTSSEDDASSKDARSLRIYCGLECEYFPEYKEYLAMLHETMDYLILGAHWTHTNEFPTPYSGRLTDGEGLLCYAENVCEGLETGYFSYLAHPDLMLMSYPVFDETAKEASRRICQEAKALGLPLEYNLLGCLRRRRQGFAGLGYPAEAFWKIAAEEGNTAILGFDAHDPEQLTRGYLAEEAYAFLKSLSIPVTETIRVKDSIS